MPAAANARIGYLDGIRAVAIAAVLCIHWGQRYGGFAPGGYVGVDLFFVLSGYIITRITWNRRETLNYKSFLQGRIRRLFPALTGLVVVTAPVVVLVGLLTPVQVLLRGAASLAQVNSFVAGLQLAQLNPFGITWSLSAEWVFYLCWPLAILALRQRTARTVALGALLAAGVLYAISLPTSFDWFYHGPISRGAQLLTGAALALATLTRRPGPQAARAVRLGAPIAAAIVVAWTFLGVAPEDPLYRWVGFPLVTVAGAILILAGLTGPTTWAVRALSLRWIRAIGRSSYSLYLWHILPLTLLDLYQGAADPLVLAAIAAAVTAALTWASYRYLEKPFLRSRSQAIEQRESAASSA